MSESGGEGDWVHHDYAEGHFRFCIGPYAVGCVRHDYPSIAKSRYGSGAVIADVTP